MPIGFTAHSWRRPAVLIAAWLVVSASVPDRRRNRAGRRDAGGRSVRRCRYLPWRWREPIRPSRLPRTPARPGTSAARIACRRRRRCRRRWRPESHRRSGKTLRRHLNLRASPSSLRVAPCAPDRHRLLQARHEIAACRRGRKRRPHSCLEPGDFKCFVSIYSAPSAPFVLICPAGAHITLETREAPVGAGYKAVLRVPHGCEGTATTSVRVRIPDGVIGVKPMPKPGWTLTTVTGKYPKTYESVSRQGQRGRDRDLVVRRQAA